MIQSDELSKVDGVTRLSRDAYCWDSVELAPQLIGTFLFYRGTLLRVTETEAYRGADDPASHAHRGITKRNAPMFAEPGHLYVYFSYGAHYCVNVVGDTSNSPSGVLIRAGEIATLVSLDGKYAISVSKELLTDKRQSAIGPGRLGRLVEARREDSGYDLCGEGAEIFLLSMPASNPNVASSPRVGITDGTDKQWRFYDRDSRCVSDVRVRR